MSVTPNMFTDPTDIPVRFVQKLSPPIFAFGESSFPVSFSFETSPREAVFSGAVVTQLDVFMTDKNVYSHAAVVQLALGESQEYTLMAVGDDITSAVFYLTTSRSDGTSSVTPEYQLAEARQPSFGTDVAHVFTTDVTTSSFQPVMKNGDPFYPSATMRLLVHRILSSGFSNLAVVDVSSKAESQVVLIPSESLGVVDVEIDVVLEWYEDAARTSPASNPPTVEMPRFGLRMYASQPSKIVEKMILSGNSCIATSLYPTSVLQNLGGNSISIAYWGSGQDGVGLFWGRVDGVEVSLNGLAMQDGSETASYLLSNQLQDYDLSSSSSESASSLNSLSSVSTMLNTSSNSSSSTISFLSSSSVSSSSNSSKSSSSSSLSSVSSGSTTTSESSLSSTELLDMSSSSSVVWNINKSSSSSLIASILAKYTFSLQPDVFNQVADDSGNGHVLMLGTTSGGIGAPIWGGDHGMSGGGFKFIADGSHSDYLQAMSPSWMTAVNSIAFWFKTTTTGNNIEIPLCFSNGYLNNASKTEFMTQLDMANGQILVNLKIDGTVKWEATTPVSSISTGSWTHFAITHDGNTPAVYIDGTAQVLTFTVGTSANKALWTTALTQATYPADRLVIGGAPRYFAPYVSLGFSGYLDELTMWDEAISAADVAAEFSQMGTLSSASFSSISSTSTS